jgi:CheY-like chemotaxis protein
MAVPTRGTILVVDDDPSVRLSLRVILEGEGHAVEEAPTGHLALRACARGGLALVVTDVRMPDVDGLELLRTLRRDHPALPVIVVTGAEVGPSGTLASMASHLGARQVLLKPMSVQDVRQAVRAVLGSAKRA